MHDPKTIPLKIKKFLAERAFHYPAIERILVYGSRARGDARERSDFDLAIVAPGMQPALWSRFALEVAEDIPTLCGVDLVLLNDTIARALRTKIEQEGVILYERAA